MNENLNLMRQAGREGVTEAMALTTRVALHISSLNQKVKMLLIMASAGLILAMNSTFAYAAACDNKGAGKALADLIGRAADFLIYVGGAAALLMFAVGALLIIMAHDSSRKRKGMDILKNAIIGLLVLGGGFFIKVVVVKFIDGVAGNNSNTGCMPSGGPGGGGG